MNRLIKTILLLLLCIGSASATVTKVDSIPNFINEVYAGGNLFKIGVLTDYYGVIFNSPPTGNLLTVVTFSCTSEGVLPASVIDTEVIVVGSGTVGRNPAVVQIKDTNHFLATVSANFTGDVDSTWVYIFGIDTADASITGADWPVVVKNLYTYDHTLIQIGTSNYYALSYRSGVSFACGMKTFLIDPDTPEILDVTVDSISTSGYSIDIDRIGSSDYYVVSDWHIPYSVSTREISQVDGTIGAAIDGLDIGEGTMKQETRFNTCAANDSIYVGASIAISGSYPRFLCSFKASPYDGSLTRGDSVAIDTKLECVSVAANDSSAIVFYSGYWTGYDGYLAAYSINPASGTFTDRQQKEVLWSENLTSTESYFSSMMLTEDSRYVLLSYRTASPYYGFLRTMLLEPNPYWGHERDGISYPNISNIDGVDISNVAEVDGVEK
ncbi:MAG TPA: hypothetical protein VMV56_07550 [Williamwhitmania sp.]|nr:hypothetical protein [Williamwhitmania sp.]